MTRRWMSSAQVSKRPERAGVPDCCLGAAGAVKLLTQARDADGKQEKGRDDHQPVQHSQHSWGKVGIEIKPDLNRMGHAEDKKAQHSQP